MFSIIKKSIMLTYLRIIPILSKLNVGDRSTISSPLKVDVYGMEIKSVKLTEYQQGTHLKKARAFYPYKYLHLIFLNKAGAKVIKLFMSVIYRFSH